MSESNHPKHHWADSRLTVSSPDEATVTGYGVDLILAWARDNKTGQPRYIGELKREQKGLNCDCVCYSCNLPLDAVNAGRPNWRRRPSFRHPKGAEKDNCLVLAARAAALEMLQRQGTLVLPLRQRSASVRGLSGNLYEAWVKSPSQRVHVSEFKALDGVSALLSLDDGRQLRVVLVGRLDTQKTAQDEVLVTPTIDLVVDDPSIAGLSREEIWKRLSVIVDEGTWCSHWNDDQLTSAATKAAEADAAKALDWIDEDAYDYPEGISDELKRETLLHIKAKEILERERRIRVPEVQVTEFSSSDCNPVSITGNSIPEQMIELESVVVEKWVNPIRPDVFARMRGMTGWHADDLLIEITVTNAITDERMERIRALNMPAIEIDLSRMGGRITETEFATLLVEEVVGKRWLHHPWMNVERARLKETQHVEQQAKFALDLMRKKIASQPNEHLDAESLRAIAVHGKLSARSENPHTDQRHIDHALDVVRIYANELAVRGHPEVLDDFFLLRHYNVLHRILSIQLDTAIGYNFRTSWQVINAILQEQKSSRPEKWHTLYLIAIKAYAPTLTKSQSLKVSNWRESVANSLKSGENRFRRVRRYDKLLSRLFPKMAGLLNRPLPGDKPPAQPEHGAIPIDEENYWLTGQALEEWKARYPDAAENWVRLGRGESD